MKIEILFFGILAEEAGCSSASIDYASDTDVLREKLVDRFPFLAKYNYLVSVNRSLVSGKVELGDGDEVALMPPFAGG